MNVIPLGERVVIEELQEEKTSGGIYIPEGSNKEQQGVIRAIGNISSVIVSIGDKVVYSGYSATKVGKYTIVDYKDLIARIE